VCRKILALNKDKKEAGEKTESKRENYLNGFGYAKNYY